jgi:tetratricopeptide (TPR) repeat protein
MALYRQERWREALAELQTYRRISGRPDQNHLIADAERALGRPERAVPLAEEALVGRGVPIAAKAEAVIVAASALADMGRFDQALGLLRRVRTSDDVARPEVLRVWYVIADVLEKAGRPREAAAQFRKIMRHDPGAYDVAERVAQLG